MGFDDYVPGNIGDRRNEPWWDHEIPDAEDIQIARDLGRPERVIEKMEAGQWGLVADENPQERAHEDMFNELSIRTLRRATHILEEAYSVDIVFDRITQTPGDGYRAYVAQGHIASGPYKDIEFEIVWDPNHTNTLDTSLPQILYKEKAYRYMESKYNEILDQVSKETGIAKPSVHALYLLKEDTLQGQYDCVPYDQALPNTPSENLANTLNTTFNFVFLADTNISEEEFNKYIDAFLIALHNENVDQYVIFSAYQDEGMPSVEYLEPENYDNRQWLVQGMVSVLVKERGLV